MTRYALNLPNALKRDAERLAKEQGVSLNQFTLWSVAEKVGGLLQGLDDSNFPNVTYRRGASGSLSPVLRETESDKWIGQIRWLNDRRSQGMRMCKAMI